MRKSHQNIIEGLVNSSEANESRLDSPPDIPLTPETPPMTVSAHFVKLNCLGQSFVIPNLKPMTYLFHKLFDSVFSVLFTRLSVHFETGLAVK